MAKLSFLTPNLFKIQKGRTTVFYLGIIIMVAALGSIIFFISGKQEEIDIEEKIRKQTPVLPSGISMTVPEKAGDLPEGFVDIPLNGNKEIIRSYTLSYSGDNYKQRAVNFISAQPMAENFKFYKTWSAQNNWSILSETENADRSILNIKKEKSILVITIAPDKTDLRLSRINISE